MFFNKLIPLIRFNKFFEVQGKKGQSLVEIAISMPILIFLLIGVFEVGSALRSYLVLVNINREITRFAVRPGYLDFSTEDTIKESYGSVFRWVGDANAGNWDASKIKNSGQLDLDFGDDGSSTLIVSHVVVDTGKPCEDINDPECNNCDDFLDPSHPTFYKDDIIVHPDKGGMEYQAESFGPSETSTGDRSSKINYDVLAAELAQQNNKFNCEIIKRGGVPSSNNVIVTEMYHDQPQLFGFPLISNPFTDPVPLYTHTVMRLIGASRSTGSVNFSNINAIGPLCLAYPLTSPQSVIDSSSIGSKIDILGGAGPSDWGWLTWNPSEDDENYLNDELAYYQISGNDYTNPNEPDDHSLSVGDYVTSMNGTINSNDTRDLMTGLVGRDIIIPIWDDTSPNGFIQLDNPNKPPPKVGAYLISSFVKVRITFEDDIQITPNKKIFATYLGVADECMP
ncbi:MAG: pilus assembly protein [Anaerolineae bacterium]|nr:pilus assembly protein [Anaerolineae bacterium]